ncbi:MAG TPA: GNAT family N-acetyltransferase [Aestuariivirgaceae bacterium]|nr:GNAT family N-acetyltransferase [Aestuariivirgaceae bacterium]
MEAVVITREDPRQPEVQRLIRELDAMFGALYPAESNHLLDIETLAGEDTRFFVVRLKGEALGCGALWLHRQYGEVKRVYVRPEARGHKIGHLIMRRLEEEARILALPLLRLETGIHQPEALGLFAAAGFAPCGAFGDYPANDANSVFMEKQIG